MAFEDWNFGGLKARVSKRVRNLPIFDDLMLGLAVNKGYVELFKHAKINTSIMEADTFILPDGDYAGQYALEYPLPAKTYKVATVNLDGFQLDGPKADHEINATGLERGNPVPQGDPREFAVRTEVDGSKTLIIWPRPNRKQKLVTFGVILPDYMVNDTDVPAMDETYGDPIEEYAAWWLLEGVEGEEQTSERYRQLFFNGRAEAKRGLRQDHVVKIRRTRQW